MSDSASATTTPLPPREEYAHLVRALANHLERRNALGIQRVSRPAKRPEEGPDAPRPEPSAPPGRSIAEPSRAGISGGKTGSRELIPVAGAELETLPESEGVRENRARAMGCTSLGELRALVAGCTACGLSETRTQTVFSDGRDHARVLFVGEAPGQHEDEKGVPFVGRAGQLLTDIIEKGMGLSRSEVYIANVLKCRPPGNRDPELEEKALCAPFLDRQIELVDPEVILALGLHSARHFLHSPLSLGRLRGRVHAWRGRKVIVTYHPAFLLRTPSAKKDCWQDIQLAMRELGILPSGPGSGTPR